MLGYQVRLVCLVILDEWIYWDLFPMCPMVSLFPLMIASAGEENRVLHDHR